MINSILIENVGNTLHNIQLHDSTTRFFQIKRGAYLDTPVELTLNYRYFTTTFSTDDAAVLRLVILMV